MKKMITMGLLAGMAYMTSFTATGKELTSLLAPYDEWYFNFFYPKALVASVTYVELLDTGAYFYRFRALDSAIPSPSTVGTWQGNLHAGIASFNKAKNPPQFIHFCWDSVIDKKVYETRITFSGTVWKMMLTPYPSLAFPGEQLYHQYMLIGLAPEGKVRVWLEDSSRPNIPLTGSEVIKIDTVSGDKLDMCKGITESDFSYPDDDDIVEFIQDKKYPYGEW